MSPGDAVLLDTLDGWQVHAPGHPGEAEALLRQAVAADDLVHLRPSLHSNTSARPVSAGFTTLREGRDGVVVAVGSMLDHVLYATTAAGDALAEAHAPVRAPVTPRDPPSRSSAPRCAVSEALAGGFEHPGPP